MTGYQRAYLHVLIVAVAAVSSTIDNCSQALAQEWKHDWVALTLGSTGIWGAATNRSRSRAIADAVKDCGRRAASRQASCGALVSTTRAAWSLAYVCGRSPFIVTGKTLSAALRRAIVREVSISLEHGSSMEPCQPVIALNPSGARFQRPPSIQVLPLLPANNESD